MLRRDGLEGIEAHADGAIGGEDADFLTRGHDADIRIFIRSRVGELIGGEGIDLREPVARGVGIIEDEVMHLVFGAKPWMSKGVGVVFAA